MAVELKVSTQELKREAENLGGIVDRILGLYNGIGEDALKFPAQWEGEASDTHRMKLNEVLEEARKTGEELKQRPGRLLTIAGVYESTEQSNVGMSADLKLDGNVIT